MITKGYSTQNNCISITFRKSVVYGVIVSVPFFTLDIIRISQHRFSSLLYINKKYTYIKLCCMRLRRLAWLFQSIKELMKCIE